MTFMEPDPVESRPTGTDSRALTGKSRLREGGGDQARAAPNSERRGVGASAPLKRWRIRPMS